MRFRSHPRSFRLDSADVTESVAGVVEASGTCITIGERFDTLRSQLISIEFTDGKATDIFGTLLPSLCCSTIRDPSHILRDTRLGIASNCVNCVDSWALIERLTVELIWDEV